MSDEEILAELERELVGVVVCDMAHEEPQTAVGINHLVCPHCEAEWSVLCCQRHQSMMMLLRTTNQTLRCGGCSNPIPALTHTKAEKL